MKLAKAGAFSPRRPLQRGDPRSLLLAGLVLAVCAASGARSAPAQPAAQPYGADAAAPADTAAPAQAAPLQAAPADLTSMSRLDQPTPGYGLAAEAPSRGFVALGDSLTAWAFAPGSWHPSAFRAWPSVLTRLDPQFRLVHNSGVPGDTTAGMVARFRSDVLAYRPDVLFVMGGANDVGSHWSTQYTVANLRKIVRSARSNGIEVVLLTIPPNNQMDPPSLEALRDANASLSRMGAEEGVLVVDVYSALVTSGGRLAGQYAAIDRLHLTVGAGETIARAVSDALDSTVPGAP